MRISWTVLVVGVWTIFSAVPSSAQDQERIGLTMGYPGSVGVLWQVSERFALRPEFGFGTSTTDLTSTYAFLGTSSSSSHGWNFGVGVNALFYVRQWDAVRAYVAPRFEYVHSSGTSSLSAAAPATGFNDALVPVMNNFSVSSSYAAYATAGSFGVQYSPARHFGVFAELGLNYTHGKSSSPSYESRTNGVTTRGGIGAIFHF